MLLLNIFIYIAILVLIFLLPGFLVTKRLVRNVDGIESLVLGGGIGICLVSLISFSIALFLNIYLKKIVLLVAAVIIILVLVKKIPQIRFIKLDRKERLILTVSLVFLILFLVRYDQTSFDYYCINQDTRNLVFGINMEGESFSREQITNHGFLYKINDVRYGSLAVVSAFVSAFDWFGFRLAYALITVLIALFSFLIVKKVFKNFILATLSMFFVLMPPLFNIHVIDENIIALMVSLLIIYLLLKEANYGLIGAIFGLLIGIRHIGVLFIIPMLFWIYFEPESRKKMMTFLFWAGFASLPWIIHHQLAFGSIFAHETLSQFGSYTHRFLAWTFNFNGLLNYPFYSEVIRTPYNAFPTFLLFPAMLFKELGLIMVSIILIGVIHMLYEKRKFGVFLVLWFVPIYLLLSFQENWLQPNKMNFILTIFSPVLIWSFAGIRWLFSNSRNKLKLSLLILFIILGGVFIKAVHLTDIPADQRFYKEYPSLVRESQGVYSFEKEKYSKINLLPSFKKGVYDIGRFIYSLNRPGEDILSYPEKAIQAEGAKDIRINLSEPLIYSKNFILSEKNAELNLLEDSAYLIPNLSLDWYDYPVNLLLIKNKFNEVILYLGYDENSYFPLDPLSIAHRGKDIREVEETNIENNQLNLKVPKNSKIILIIRLAKEETIYYSRTIETKDSGFLINEAVKMYNN